MNIRRWFVLVLTAVMMLSVVNVGALAFDVQNSDNTNEGLTQDIPVVPEDVPVIPQEEPVVPSEAPVEPAPSEEPITPEEPVESPMPTEAPVEPAPSEEPITPEEPVESPEPTETPIEPSPTPFMQTLLGGTPSPITVSPDGSFVAAGESVTLTVTVAGVVKNLSVSLGDETLGTLDASALSSGTVTFTANTSGLTGTETVVVNGTDTNGNPVEGSAYVYVAHKYNVRFSDVNNTSKIYTGPETVYGGQQYTFTFKEIGDDFYCYNYEWKTYTSEELKVEGVTSEGNFTIDVPEKITPVGGAPDATLVIELTGSGGKDFDIKADTSPESTAADTLYFEKTTGTYKQEEPFTLLIKHPEYIKPVSSSEPESDYVYYMPTLKMKDKDGVWQDYYGFYLETVTNDEEYAKLWKLCIPGEDIRGDILVFAEKMEKLTDDPTTLDVDETTIVRSISFQGSSSSTVDEAILGLSVFSKEALASTEARAKDYYFSLTKEGAPNRSVGYYIGSSTERKVPEQVGENLYKIAKEDLTDDILISIKDPNVFEVTKQGSGKGEEVLIELPSDTVSANTAYTFNVKHHEMNIATQFPITVTINGIDYIVLDGENPNPITLTVDGDYWKITIPASMVTGDILISASCTQDVKCAVIFEDNYYAAEKYLSYRFTAFKIVLVTTNDQGVTTRTLLDDYINPTTRKIKVELAPYTNLRFEVVTPNTNSSGKYYTDPNTNCYAYNFYGSKMATRSLGTEYYFQDNLIYLLDYSESQEYDGTYHMDYIVGELTGDTVIKLKPYMFKFGVSVTGTGKDAIKMDKTYASYRSNFKFTNEKPKEVEVEKITVGGKTISEDSGYTKSGDTYTITGGYIKGDIVITANIPTDPSPSPTPGYYYQEEGTRYSGTSVSTKGTEYELDVSSFRRINNGYYIYLITAKGEPAEGMYPSYDGHEMVYYEPYEAYVWLTVSNDNSETFFRNADDLFDELSADDLEKLKQDRLKSGKSTEEKENEIAEAIKNNTVLGDLNADGEVDSEDIEIARKLYMNTDPGMKDYSLGQYLLADVNLSETLDMKDVAMIRKLASGSKDDTEKERTFTLELSADGEKKVTANKDDEISVDLKLIRTDKVDEDDAAVSCIQDELRFDGKLLELLEDSELADGVEIATGKYLTGNRKDDIKYINVTYVESDDAEKLGKETVLATFKFKVLDNDASCDVTHNNGMITALDGETVYSCKFVNLTVESEKIMPTMCAVTFDYNGAAENDEIEILEGSLVSAPLILPEYKGHVFAGWYKDKDCTEAWDFENDVVESDVTLYAKWDAVKSFNPIWIGVIAIALLAAGGAAILIYRRRYY